MTGLVGRMRRSVGLLLDLGAGCARPPAVGTGVIILGMHRSGTSALTGVIDLLGVAVSDEDDIMVGDEANQRGYWESRQLTDFQELLLQRFGGTWRSPPSLPVGWERDPKLRQQLGRARRIFRRLYGKSRLWAWKDPRTALLLPFWRRALRFRPLIAVIHRHPLEVARSLEVRDGLPLQDALQLWEQYNRAILIHAAGLPAYVVSYERVVDQPGTVANELRRFLVANGVELPEVGNGRVEALVDPALRHAALDDADLNEQPLVTDGQRALVARLRFLDGPHVALPS